MAWDMSAPGSTNLLQKDDGHWRDSSWSWLAIWARNCSCLDCLMVCCVNWACRTHGKWLLKLPKEGKKDLRGSCFMKEFAKHLHDAEESDRQIANIGRTVFEISCLMEKSARYYGPVGWRQIFQLYRWTLGDFQQDVSVNSVVLEVAYNVLPVYLGNIVSFWGLWRVEER